MYIIIYILRFNSGVAYYFPSSYANLINTKFMHINHPIMLLNLIYFSMVVKANCYFSKEDFLMEWNLELWLMEN